VNAPGALDTAIPFGGLRQSGRGRGLGAEAISRYTQPKSVNVAL
jgi:acyl-CoA reductase-like NAD-dependent aldehyde dehydrogenase